MSRIVRFIKWFPKNPKKSIFFGSILAYGANYFHKKIQISNLMREYCQEARKYGEIKSPVSTKLKKVLVIINPAADKRNAEDNFNEFCAPVLNLAGYMIDIIKTQSENDAITTVQETKDQYDAIIIAGGDGTISETITGLMRRDDNFNATIGGLPLGSFNQFSLMHINSTTNVKNKVEKVRSMAESALAIVKGNTRKEDVMKIELIPEYGEEQEPKKPFYAVGSVWWGSFNDIIKKRDKYWLTASLRDYSAFLFNGLFPREGIRWNCKAKLIYSEPCQGCSNCYEKVETKTQKLQSSRWWAKFNAKEIVPEYSKILNPNCLIETEIDFDNSSEIAITTNTLEAKKDDKSQLNVKFNEVANNYSFDYIWQSWKRVNERNYLNIPDSKVINARQIKLLPQISSGDEGYFGIDNNAFEVRPIKITVLPKRIEFFVL